MEIQNLSVAEFRAAIKSGKLSATDAAEQTIASMERHRELNTIISTDEALIRTRASALDKRMAEGEMLPLHGLPVLVKDNIDTADFPTTGGTPALAKHQPEVTAGVVRRLEEAGALIVGKANMHELAFGITSNNAFTGAVRNPYDENCIPGGSSGGSAAAVSAKIVPVALGSDTGGSNRIPAALCGVCGFRPTIGRYPDDHLINLSLTRDTVGIFAGSVRDIIAVDVIMAEDSRVALADLNSLRLAIPRDPFYRDLEHETAEIMEQTLDLLKKKGVTLVEIDMPELLALNEKVSFTVALFETLRELSDYLARNNTGIDLEQLTASIASPDVKHIMEAAQGEMKVPEQVYLDALNVQRPRLQQMYADFFSENNIDAMLYATTPLTARPIGQDETVDLNGQQVPTFPSFTRNGDPSSNAGIPSLVIPAGLATNGLPVGLSIDGPYGKDIEVLGIGAALQELIPPIQDPFL